MKKNCQQASLVLGAFVLLLLSSCSAHAASETNAVPTNAIPKSIFQDDARNGKDPFFPKSTRRAEKLPTATENVVAPLVQLALKGISGPANRRFALINNQTLATGETAVVRIGNGQVKVHCWEIREDSVIVSVEGNPEKRELRLREGL